MFNTKKRKQRRLIKKWRDRAESHKETADRYHDEGDEIGAELAETIAACFRLCAIELEKL